MYVAFSYVCRTSIQDKDQVGYLPLAPKVIEHQENVGANHRAIILLIPRGSAHNNNVRALPRRMHHSIEETNPGEWLLSLDFVQSIELIP